MFVLSNAGVGVIFSVSYVYGIARGSMTEDLLNTVGGVIERNEIFQFSIDGWESIRCFETYPITN